MRTLRLVLSAAVAVTIFGGPERSAAADPLVPPPGAQTCVGCHGQATSVPAISGRDAGEIEAAMAQFRDGSRSATIMNRISKGFTADETRAIAQWLATGGEGR